MVIKSSFVLGWEEIGLGVGRDEVGVSSEEMVRGLWGLGKEVVLWESLYGLNLVRDVGRVKFVF